jgi:hypothetical protein
VDGDSAGTFRNASVTCAPVLAPCCFSDSITFNTPNDYNTLSATFSSILGGANLTTNIDFTSVTINGVGFAIGSTGCGRIPLPCELTARPGQAEYSDRFRN